MNDGMMIVYLMAGLTAVLLTVGFLFEHYLKGERKKREARIQGLQMRSSWDARNSWSEGLPPIDD